VVVEFLNAIITIAAVSRPQRPDYKARLADSIPSDDSRLDDFKLSFSDWNGFDEESSRENPSVGECGEVHEVEGY